MNKEMKTAAIFLFSLMFLGRMTCGRGDYGSLAVSEASDVCLAQIGAVQFKCPPGWNIVDEDARGITIGDFKRKDKTTNLTIPAGHATIKLSSMPKVYSDLKQWIYAGSKMAPESVQTQGSVTNTKLGSIPVTVLSSPQSARGLAYVSYFFEIKGKPFNLELSFQRASKNAVAYEGLEKKLIAELEPSSGS